MSTEDTKLVPYQQQSLVPYDDMLRMAAAFAKSGLFGVKTPEQALALMLIAQAEGLHPAVAARDYDIIQGRPAKKSEAMLRSFIASDGQVEWHELTDAKAEATFTHPSGGTIRLDWTMDRAKRAGLLDKKNRDGSDNMWQKYPRQMLRARVISEGVRTICPSATSGLYAPEEVAGYEVSTRMRKGRGGFTFKEPEAVDVPHQIPGTWPVTPKPQPEPSTAQSGLVSPEASGSKRPDAAVEETVSIDPLSVMKAIENAKTLEELIKVADMARQLPDGDRETARELYAVRKKQLSVKVPNAEAWI